MKHDPLMLFVLRLFDADDLGQGVTKEVHEAAKAAFIEKLELETRMEEIQ